MGLAAAARAARDAPAYERDEVKSLPGWDGALPSRHFSGYLQASPTKRLHYYLVQSEGDWNKDPVVLWFNGGPGCFLDGFLYEHGPFRVQYDGKAATLARFDYAWSKLATMVYIEAPCGVGFSYSTAKDTRTRDYNATDDTAALDNLAAVESLFDKFPKLKSRRFVHHGRELRWHLRPDARRGDRGQGKPPTRAPSSRASPWATAARAPKSASARLGGARRAPSTPPNSCSRAASRPSP